MPTAAELAEALCPAFLPLAAVAALQRRGALPPAAQAAGEAQAATAAAAVAQRRARVKADAAEEIERRRGEEREEAAARLRAELPGLLRQRYACADGSQVYLFQVCACVCLGWWGCMCVVGVRAGASLGWGLQLNRDGAPVIFLFSVRLELLRPDGGG